MILLLLFYHLQGLFLIVHEILLDPYMILHHFLLFLNIQIKQFNQKIIVIIPNKLLVNTMIHLNTPFFHHLIQIFEQTIIKNVSQNNKHTNLMTQHPYAHLLQPNSSPSNFHSKIKEHPFQTLYNLLKEDPKIIHFHIYLLTLYIN